MFSCAGVIFFHFCCCRVFHCIRISYYFSIQWLMVIWIFFYSLALKNNAAVSNLFYFLMHLFTHILGVYISSSEIVIFLQLFSFHEYSKKLSMRVLFSPLIQFLFFSSFLVFISTNVHFHQEVQRVTVFFTSLTTSVLSFFLFGYSGGFLVVSHYGFSLHFPNDLQCLAQFFFKILIYLSEREREGLMGEAEGETGSPLT